MQSGATLGQFKVLTTNNRGFSVEEVAEIFIDKMVYVGGNCHPLIREQAIAFKDGLRDVLKDALREMVSQDRMTMCTKLEQQGRGDLANIIRSI